MIFRIGMTFVILGLVSCCLAMATSDPQIEDVTFTCGLLLCIIGVVMMVIAT